MIERKVRLPHHKAEIISTTKWGHQQIYLNDADRISYTMFPITCQVSVYRRNRLQSMLFVDRPVQITF